MNESLLVSDIKSFLRDEAMGRDKAIPRHVLLKYLHALGHAVSDRTLRRIYAAISEVGYVIDGERRGLFWITTKAEAKEVEAMRRGQGMACLIHAKESGEAKNTGAQGELF